MLNTNSLLDCQIAWVDVVAPPLMQMYVGKVPGPFDVYFEQISERRQCLSNIVFILLTQISRLADPFETFKFQNDSLALSSITNSD